MNFPWMDKNPAYAAFKVGRCTYGTPKILEYSHRNPNPCFSVGSFTMISSGVVVVFGGERLDWVTSAPLFAIGLAPSGKVKPDGWNDDRGNVVIGNDVWIGMDALIMAGVTIGHGAVVGARSVVTRDVAPYSVTAGNPARHRRFRFDEDTIRKLLEISWWDWPDEKIKENWAMLHGDARQFVERHWRPE